MEQIRINASYPNHIFRCGDFFNRLEFKCCHDYISLFVILIGTTILDLFVYVGYILLIGNEEPMTLSLIKQMHATSPLEIWASFIISLVWW